MGEKERWIDTQTERERENGGGREVDRQTEREGETWTEREK